VLIANDDDAISDIMEEVLKGRKNLEVTKAHDGVEALKAIEDTKPHVAILDVALSKLYGFEICTLVRDNPALKDTKLILLSSIYNPASFKRTPSSLYGADDYLEKHHIYDKMIPKIERLVGGAVKGAMIRESPAKEAPLHSKRNYAERLSAAERPVAPEDKEAHEKAKKLARLIISDIVLYNSEHIDESIKNDNFHESIQLDIKDGIKFFKKRFPANISAESYIKEALDEFLSKKKGELA
jgi:DNA-binding response OmpR family regulator